MSRFTKNFSRQYVGLFAVLFIAFALIFTASAESAQTSKTKPKAAPTPKKSASPKTAPTPKKSDKSQTSSSKNSSNKSADKNKKSVSKTNDKSSAKSSKDTKKSADSTSKNAKDKDKKSSAATSKTTDKNKKPTDKKSSDKTASKNSATDKKSNDSKAKTKSVATKENKPTIAKNDKKPASPKPVAVKNSAPKTSNNSSVQTPKAQAFNQEIIVTNLSSRLRAQAAANSSEIGRVRVGTILKATEKNSSWYKVQFTANGKSSSAWISANSVENLNAYKREEIYRQIIESNYKPQSDFQSAAELTDFLSRVSGEDSFPELELKRLLILRETLRKIPVGQRDASPYREFLAANDKSIVYSEPAGEWFVSSNLFWDLHKKYQSSSISDRIAWEAAQNPLPGECEGYVNCRLFYVRMTMGEYLRLHPQGLKSGDALKDLTNFLEPIAADASQKTVYQGPTDATDRAEFNNLIAELRTIVSRLAFPEKEKTLQQLKQIGESYR